MNESEDTYKDSDLRRDIMTWNWKNSIPYLIACALPTALLVMGLISGLHWTLIFFALVTGLGLIDLKNVSVAGSSINFDDEDHLNEE